MFKFRHKYNLAGLGGKKFKLYNLCDVENIMYSNQCMNTNQ